MEQKIDFMKFGNFEMYDVYSEITRQYLIDCYATSLAFPDEPDSNKLLKSLRCVIKHVSNPEQWKEFTDAF